MKFIKKNRTFLANKRTKIKLKNIGCIQLKKNDHLVIETSRKKNELCAMEWGFYITSSLNQRLKKQKISTYLIENNTKKKFVLLVLDKKKKLFMKYCKSEKFKSIKKIN